jgi:hypothetical protein
MIKFILVCSEILIQEVMRENLGQPPGWCQGKSEFGHPMSVWKPRVSVENVEVTKSRISRGGRGLLKGLSYSIGSQKFSIFLSSIADLKTLVFFLLPHDLCIFLREKKGRSKSTSPPINLYLICEGKFLDLVLFLFSFLLLLFIYFSHSFYNM